MNAQQWRNARELFDALADLPRAEQAARLAALDADDHELHDLIAALLDADGRGDDQLERIEAFFLSHSREQTPTTASADVFGLRDRMLAHFRITQPLGAGGMGVVYRAEDTRLHRSVAVKVPLLRGIDISAKQRFLREARSAAALDHPNVCSIYEVGESDEGQPFLAMPLYAGETLKERLARERRLPIEAAVEIARQVAEGLAAMHSAGIVHRDIKPSNVMLLPDGVVKILDFGLAKVADLTASDAHAQLGTIAYMSPECIRGQAADGRSDLWALGVMLYEMVTGARPFEGDHDMAVAHAILYREPVRPLVRRRDLPAALDAIVFQLLRKNRRKRPATAQQVAYDLRMLQEQSVPQRRRLRQRWLMIMAWRQPAIRWTALASIILALAVTAGFLATRSTLHPDAVAPVRSGSGSIAVLPFANLSGDKQQEYLSDGITEELTTYLSTVPGLHVMSRSSANHFKGKTADARAVGKLLGVAALLRGTLQKTGSRLRITAELMDASSGEALWSGTYERDVSELFVLHDQINHAVVSALRLRLPEPSGARNPPTRNAEAYELYLKGRYFSNQRTEESLRRATEYFRSAASLDSTYGEAYVGLAEVEIAPRSGRPAERFAFAKTIAAKALAMDSLLPEAHIAMSWINMWYDRDWKSAEFHIRRAVELKPREVWAVSRYAAYLAAIGRVQESLPVILRAHRLDPLSYAHTTYVGTHFLWARREDEAIRYFRNALELKPDFFMAHWGLGRAYLRKGWYTEALKELSYEGGDYTGLNREGLLGHAYAVSGNERAARRLLAELHRKSTSDQYVPPVALAIIYIGLGEKSRALDWLERVEADRGARIFLADPIFDPIREDPRFRQLHKRLTRVEQEN